MLLSVLLAVSSTAPASAAPPSNLTNVTATTSTNAGQINVSWGGGNGANYYHVSYRAAGGSGWTPSYDHVTVTSYVLGALTPGSSYDIRVAASNSDGHKYGYVNNVAAGGSAGDKIVLTMPLFKVMPGYASATLSWQGVDEAHGYKIRWRTASPAGSWTTVDVASNTNGYHTFTGLTSGTTTVTNIEFQMMSKAYIPVQNPKTLDVPPPPPTEVDSGWSAGLTASINKKSDIDAFINDTLKVEVTPIYVLPDGSYWGGWIKVRWETPP